MSSHVKPSTRLIRVCDKLSIVRNMLECAFMACDTLPDPDRNGLATVIHEAQRRLEKEMAKVEAVAGDLPDTPSQDAKGGAA